MKKYILLSLLLAVTLGCVMQAQGQGTLVLKKGLRKITLRKGTVLMPLFRNDTVAYLYWKNACRSCPQLPADSIWRMDGIAEDGELKIKRVAAYEYDTLTRAEMKALPRTKKKEISKEWIAEKVLYNKKNKRLSATLFKKPVYAFKTIRVPDLRGFRLARHSCRPDNRVPLIGLTVIAGISAIAQVAVAVTAVQPAALLLLAISLPAAITGVAEFNAYKVKTYRLSEWKWSVK